MPKSYLFLMLAILSEVIGTSALQASQQFTRMLPLSLMVVCYGLAFYFMSLSLKTMHVGVVYAIWSGMGVVLIGVVGWLWFGQKLDAGAVVGMALIVSGVAVIHLFSNSSAH